MMSVLRHSIEFHALQFLARLLRLLPHNASLVVGENLGYLVYLLKIRTEVTRDNLRRAFPDYNEEQIEKIVLGCYRHFGALLAEFARLPLLRSENIGDFVETDDRSVLDESQARGKGGIVVSGHLGNWELMGASTAVLGYPVSYVVTDQQNPKVDRFMDQLRESAGVRIIKRKDAIKGIIKAMRNNELVAILSDQDAHEAGAFVPFFGRPASTPRGAATFALRTGSDLIFVESYRQGRGKLKVIHEFVSLEVLPDDRDAAVHELTRRITARLEEAVRRHPEQWFWMHRRWKTSPP
jgi:KDO2-lipid IV(A) lauroyltransferase